MSRRLLVILSLALLPALLAGCSAGGAQTTVRLAPAAEMPAQVQQAPERVRTAYQFAVANPAALENVPCYCGCGTIGHHSNLACYVKQQAGPDGKPVFDDHAMGCSICVDIAQDVRRMTEEGKEPAAIRADIVAAYSKFGPSNQ